MSMVRSLLIVCLRVILDHALLQVRVVIASPFCFSQVGIRLAMQRELPACVCVCVRVCVRVIVFLPPACLPVPWTQPTSSHAVVSGLPRRGVVPGAPVDCATTHPRSDEHLRSTMRRLSFFLRICGDIIY